MEMDTIIKIRIICQVFLYQLRVPFRHFRLQKDERKIPNLPLEEERRIQEGKAVPNNMSISDKSMIYM